MRPAAQSVLAALLLLSLAWVAAAQGGMPQPDLALRAPAMLPPAPAEGEGVFFNVTAFNQGDSGATGVQVSLYVDGALLFASGALVLLPGQQANVTNPTPWEATAGEHDFLAVIDPDDAVLESDENNNEAGFAFAAGPRPNLALAALGWSPAQPQAGDDVNITATVENAGAAAAGSFRVDILVDGAPVANATLPGLAPGARANVTAAWRAESGAHSVTAIADALDEVAETDESDNARTQLLEVPLPPGQPDLVVKDLRSLPASPIADQDVRFEALVRNDGGAPAGASGTRFRIGATDLGEMETRALAPGEEVWVRSVAWRALAGSHALLALADASDDLAEADEANNERTEPVQVAVAPGQPDLVVQLLEAAPAQPQAGDAVTLAARVRNAGEGAAGEFVVEFRVGNALVGAASVGALAAGAVADVHSPPWTAAQGAHVARALADSAAQVAEADEANNVGTLALPVAAAKPDLFLEALRTSPATPLPGRPLTFEAVVRNAGAGASGAFHVQFRVDGETVDTVGVPEGLAAGAMRVVRAEPWTATQGARLARAVVDPGHFRDETNEDNNERTLTLPSLSRLPNLVLEELRLASSGAETSVRLFAVVANEGSEPSPSTEVRFQVDGAALPLQAVPGLAPGGRFTVTSAEFEARGGAHNASAVVDPSGQVAELDEDDNARSTRFLLGAALAPDATGLELGAPRIAPAAPGPGDRLTVSVDVENLGPAPAGEVVLRLRVDGATVASAAIPSMAPGARATHTLGWTATSGAHTLEVEALQGSQVVASSPAREIMVGAAGGGAGWVIGLLVLLAFAVLALAAWGVVRGRTPR